MRQDPSLGDWGLRLGSALIVSSPSPSIFDREDETSSRAGSLAALEKRQAEKKKELMKAQSLPKTSASQARKAMIEKLEKEGAAG